MFFTMDARFSSPIGRRENGDLHRWIELAYTTSPEGPASSSESASTLLRPSV
jgi:hypothetical protein